MKNSKMSVKSLIIK